MGGPHGGTWWKGLDPQAPASCRGSCDRPGAQQVEGRKVMNASLPHPPSLGQSGGEVRAGTAGPSFRVLTCRQQTEGPEPWKLGNREKGVPTAQHRAGDALGWVLRRGGGLPVCTHRQHPPPLGEPPVERAAFKPVAGTGALPAEPNFPEPLVSTLTVRDQMCPRISE